MDTPQRKPYLTDLTDEQWAILEPLIPPAKWGGRPREVNLRAVLNCKNEAIKSALGWKPAFPSFRSGLAE